MRRFSPVPLLLAAVLTLAAACGDGGGNSQQAAKRPATEGGSVSTRLPVVATTTHLTDFVRIVGGDHVDVYGILKPNVDAHDFEPSPADIAELAQAKIIVKNGVGLEEWFDSTIRNAGTKATIVEAAQGVTIRRGEGGHDDEAEEGHEGEEAHADGDPHIWQDPRNAKVMVRHITAALVAADPAHRADYEANEAAYRAELDRLDAEIAAEIAGLTNKKIVTNHDAFGYYIDRYGLEFVGSIIPSFDSQAELSARDISNIVKRIKATGVKAVFSESSLPPKTAEAIGREAGVAVVAGDDALYGDSLGPPGSAGDTYLRMLRHNTRQIVDHLR
ncbi:MAG: metal ABC transporter substrate-binding protein [Actinomycetota bacterium]|jgi:zinc/manganese transport system substrate-binding protein